MLHTWARDLTLHPHAHCIVTAGGLSLDGVRWVDTERDFLFPLAVLAKLFRGKFLEGLTRSRGTHGVGRHLSSGAFDTLVDSLYKTDRNVYAKAPFAGPRQVFRYLGQHTHRVGISNHRLLSLDARGVTFRTRGTETVTLDDEGFIKRFLARVLPFRFVKIRHSGLMANGGAVLQRERARALLTARHPMSRAVDAPIRLVNTDWQQALEALTGIDLAACRRCGRRTVVRRPLPPAHAGTDPSAGSSSARGRRVNAAPTPRLTGSLRLPATDSSISNPYREARQRCHVLRINAPPAAARIRTTKLGSRLRPRSTDSVHGRPVESP